MSLPHANRFTSWPKLPTARLLLPALALVAFGSGLCAGRQSASQLALDVSDLTAGGSSRSAIWTCSMHPQIQRSGPGPCPICGMDLVPVTAEDTPEEEHVRGRIVLGNRAKSLARVRTVEVVRTERPEMARRLLGRVDYDETTLRTVTAWTGGRIDRLHVTVTGQRVRRGQTIATIYSPELYEAHQDLILARQRFERAAASDRPGTAAIRPTLNAVRQRLRLLGVPEAQIEAMEKAEAPFHHFPIRTPFGGTVVERLTSEGSYISTGAELYRIADLAQVWVQLDAYESDLPLLSIGRPVRIESRLLPGRTLEGHVAFVDPVIDPQTRTARVRISVANPEGELRPGGYVEAVVDGDPARVGEAPLLIPETAPLFTGRRSVVYVELPGVAPSTYELRVVRLGPRIGAYYPVLAGLREGERVIEQGAFAVDADLQIRGEISMMSVPDDTEPGPYDTLFDPPEAMRAALAEVTQSYLSLHGALTKDALAQARESSRKLREALNEVFLAGELGEALPAWRSIEHALSSHSAHLQHARSLREAREAFESLTASMKELLEVFGNPLESPLVLMRCPGAVEFPGAVWFQAPAEVRNPYEGASMLECGRPLDTMEPGARPIVRPDPPMTAPIPEEHVH